MTRTFLIILSTVVHMIQMSDLNESFIATNNWKVIQKDQSIPQGLHIRINLQTGLKEAKLLNDRKKIDENPLSVQFEDQKEDIEEEKIINRLEEALKNIPANNVKLSEDEINEIKRKYKTYDYLKKELKNGDAYIKSDNENINHLVQRYVSIDSSRTSDNLEIIAILEDLQHLSHQVDNALNFISSHGMEKIILPNLLNQSNDKIRTENLKLLGIILINNPEVRLKFKKFEKNVGISLIQILGNSKNIHEISSCIFALGSLIRHFPSAKQELILKGGASVLVDILVENDAFNLKVKVKSLILITDLIKESTDENDDTENNINIENIFKSLHFCENCSKFFINIRNELNMFDADQAEKVIQSFLTAKSTCEHQWAYDEMFRHTLLVVRSHYENKYMESEKSDEFASDIVESINDLNNFLYQYLENKDEL